MKEEAKLLETYEKFKLYEFSGKLFMIFDNKFEKERINDYNFPNIDVRENVSGSSNTYVNLNDNELTNSLLEYINNELNEEKDVFDLLNSLSNNFLKVQSDNKKFRGDVGELLYLKYYGGKKWLFEGSFDIVDKDDNTIEVKSFSTPRNQITISLQQLEDESRKFAVPFIASNTKEESMTIIDLIEATKSFMDIQYYNILIKRYSKSMLRHQLFKLVKPFEVTDQLSFPKLDDNVRGGDLLIEVKFDREEVLNKNI